VKQDIHIAEAWTPGLLADKAAPASADKLFSKE